ncbi:substrate-binding domain-containing protein [Phreatobacter sp.]|uniref:substrate-binding domain-containing protein n=1 Tax=Phreatobacter sp. TaxID=1966341 RepID=UPI003F6E7218
MITRRHLILTCGALALAGTAALAQDPRPATPQAAAGTRFITVASTTSTVDSGLFNHLLPLFKAKTGIDVRVISQGTGQALDTGRRGDADVVFVHARAAEEKFVADGFGGPRRPVMFNDFVLIGPQADTSGIRGTRDIVAALKTIQSRALPFVSRGDRSGTHQAELALWRAAGIDLAATRGSWYREIGQGMGAALNTASGMNGFVLSDRGTWLSFRNRGGLAVLVEGDRRLANQYGIMLVSQQRHPHVKTADAQAFIDWVTGPEGQKAIADYKIGGEQLFFPNATESGV